MKRLVLLLGLAACSSSTPPTPTGGSSDELAILRGKLELVIDVEREPGYRCGSPDPTADPIYACANIDTFFVVANNAKNVYVFTEHFGEHELTIKCPSDDHAVCQPTLNGFLVVFKPQPEQTWIIATDRPVDVTSHNIDIALLEARRAQAQVKTRRIVTHY